MSMKNSYEISTATRVDGKRIRKSVCEEIYYEI